MVGAAAIRTDTLTKRFGSVIAVDELSLQVHEGEVFGFLGPNGAGKSTVIRILVDLLRPTAGSVEVLGHSPNTGRAALRARVGYLPGELHLPRRPTGGTFLNYLTRLRGGHGRDQIEMLAERFQLDLSRPIGDLSKGNKQKIGVVQAFLHTPDLLVLDEPTSGLDPLLQHEFRELVVERRNQGATVFMSSHVLSEVEDVADRVAIIRSGRLVDIETIPTLRRLAGQDIELRFEGAVDEAVFEHMDGVSDLSLSTVDTDTTVLRCLLRGHPDELLRAASHYRVLGWKATDRPLEDLFLSYYRDV